MAFKIGMFSSHSPYQSRCILNIVVYVGLTLEIVINSSTINGNVLFGKSKECGLQKNLKKCMCVNVREVS